jgi:hypothetical protein
MGQETLAHPAGEKPERTRRERARWPWFIGGALLALGKAQGFAAVFDHRSGLIVVLALMLVGSVLRPRPALVAATVAALLALALDLHPLVAGVALGLGAFLLLMVLFVGIATVLHARQGATSSRGRTRHGARRT